jgi:hypothetical protein
MTDKILAAGYAIGALSSGERADATRRRLSDPSLDEMIDDHEAMMAPLAGMAGNMAPPPELKARVMAAVAQSGHFETHGKQLYPFASGNWRNVFPGVDMKRLWARGPKLMRCAPVSIIPAHEHLEDEHLVVLSGDFVLEGRRFCLGDHLFSPHGTRHGVGTTETGCVLLIHDG